MSREIRDDDDIRELLGGVLQMEPPMTIDRAAVLSAGKRALRRRRLAAATGVAAGVVAVALGATAIAGPSALFGGPDLGPAVPAPPRPSVSEVAPTMRTSPVPPATTRLAPPTAVTSVPMTKGELNAADPVAQQIAVSFSTIFTSLHPLPSWAELSPRGARFQVTQGGLKLVADLKDSQGVGSFRFDVVKNAPAVSCAGATASTCETLELDPTLDRRVTGVYTVTSSGPVVTNTLFVNRYDGFQLVLSSTNRGSTGEMRPTPTLTKANLISAALVPAYPYW
ncbi:hypothetical protein [Allokutzneria oryzae]|uniref:Uncharacterized protein n=1 Tax=Allokutzneria oryzae TaxID=1378989 RepID=A0ABV5ZVU5_9PSEU